MFCKANLPTLCHYGMFDVGCCHVLVNWSPAGKKTSTTKKTITTIIMIGGCSLHFLTETSNLSKKNEPHVFFVIHTSSDSAYVCIVVQICPLTLTFIYQQKPRNTPHSSPKPLPPERRPAGRMTPSTSKKITLSSDPQRWKQRTQELKGGGGGTMDSNRLYD